MVDCRRIVCVEAGHMTTSRVTTVLIAVARRRCTPQDFDAVVLPIIADIHFENAAATQRSTAVRALIHVRGYVALCKAVAFTVVLDCWRNPMHSKGLAWLRMAVAIPA